MNTTEPHSLTLNQGETKPENSEGKEEPKRQYIKLLQGIVYVTAGSILIGTALHEKGNPPVDRKDPKIVGKEDPVVKPEVIDEKAHRWESLEHDQEIPHGEVIVITMPDGKDIPFFFSEDGVVMYVGKKSLEDPEGIVVRSKIIPRLKMCIKTTTVKAEIKNKEKALLMEGAYAGFGGISRSTLAELQHALPLLLNGEQVTFELDSALREGQTAYMIPEIVKPVEEEEVAKE